MSNSYVVTDGDMIQHEVYVALLDADDHDVSIVLGVFAREDDARRACADEEAERNETSFELEWTDDNALGIDGRYWTRLIPVGERVIA